MPGIDKQTGVSIGLVLVLLGAMFYLGARINDIDRGLDSLKKTSKQAAENAAKIEALEVKAEDRYTLTAASETAFRHAIANPGVRVPDPRHPGDFIFVESGNLTSPNLKAPPTSP